MSDKPSPQKTNWPPSTIRPIYPVPNPDEITFCRHDFMAADSPYAAGPARSAPEAPQQIGLNYLLRGPGGQN